MAVVLVVISKLSHRSACLEQSIHPTLTRPSCREKQVEERLQCSFMLTRQKRLLLNALRHVTLQLNLMKHDQLNAYQHSSKLPPCLRFQTICKIIWLFRIKKRDYGLEFLISFSSCLTPSVSAETDQPADSFSKCSIKLIKKVPWK